jgi:hypothetical protein
MYGYYGAGYDLGDYEGDDMGELDGVMDIAKKEVFGIPVWALGLGALALAYTGVGKKVLGMVGLGKKASKKNPKRRRSRKAVRRNRHSVAMKMNRRRRSRRSRR